MNKYLNTVRLGGECLSILTFDNSRIIAASREEFLNLSINVIQLKIFSLSFCQNLLGGLCTIFLF